MKISERILRDYSEFELSVMPKITDRTIMSIDISSICNEQCIYCPSSLLGYHKKGRLIDEQLFKRVTKEAYDLGVREIGLYLFGEPFTNPKLADYVKYLKDMGYRYVYVSTNGILCTPEKFKQIADLGLDSIKFSVSGATEKTFQAHHGISGFDTVVNNLKFVYDYRQKSGLDYKIFVFSILTELNKHEENEMRKLFEPLSDEFTISKVFNKALYQEMFSEELFGIDYSKNNRFGSATAPCAQPFNKLIVTTSGYLCICCCAGMDRYAVADLNQISLADAYYCDAFKQIRQRHIDDNLKGCICGNCMYGYEEPVHAPNVKLMPALITKETRDISDLVKTRFGLED